MPRLRRFAIFFLTGIFYLSPIIFNSPLYATESLRLSLSDAIRMALSSGTASKLAALDVRAAKAQSDLARAALLPQLQASYTQSNQIVNLKAYGFAQPGAPSVVGPFSVYDAHIDAALRVIDLAAIDRYRAARKTSEAAKIAYQRAQNDIAAAVAILYTGLARASARAKDAEATARLFHSIQTLTQHQLNAGLTTTLDVHRSSAQLAGQEQLALMAADDVNRLRLALLHAVGAPLDREIVVLDTDTADAHHPPSMSDALLQASQERPEVSELAAQTAATKLALSAEKSAYFPNLSVQFRGGYNGDHITDLDWNRAIAGTVTLPIWNGGQTAATIAQARIRVEQLRAQRKEVMRQIEEDVRRTHATHHAAKERLKIAKQNVALAHEEVEVALNRFKNGVATTLDIDHAETALSSAQELYNITSAEESESWFSLLRSTGGIRALIPKNSE